MKKNSQVQAMEALGALAKEVDATFIEGGYLPDEFFEMIISENENVYIWDRKYGLEKTNPPSYCVHLGDVILQGLKNEKKSRFSYIGVHNSIKSIFTIYQSKMSEVQFWRTNKDMEAYYDEKDYESYVTSSLGLSGSL